MSEFLSMGGYGLWVWSAYGLTVLIMVANLIAARIRLRNRLAQLRRLSGRGSRP